MAKRGRKAPSHSAWEHRTTCKRTWRDSLNYMADPPPTGIEQLEQVIADRSRWTMRIVQREGGEGEKGEGEEMVTWEETRGFHQPPFCPVPVPKELPDLRLHLLSRWEPGGMFRQVLQQMPVTTADWETRALKEASLWWVKDDMVRLTVAAIPSIPADLHGHELTLPANQAYGLAVLEEPWVGLDADSAQTQVTVHAVLWGLSRIEDHSCFSMSCYQYADFGQGMDPGSLSKALRQQALKEGYQIPIGETRDGQKAYSLRGGAWVFLGRTDWPLVEKIGEFHVELGHIPQGIPLTEQRQKAFEEDRRFLAAFSVLVNHRLSEAEVIHPQRQTQRRSERAGVTTPSTVTYIRLRQVVHGDRDEGGERRQVEWSHRWFSRGHMGWRRCGPKHSQRKLVYVNPSIKGPADKPLVVKTQVRTWVR